MWYMILGTRYLVRKEAGMKIKNYRDLDVWKLSKEWAKEIYGITQHYPVDERFGLTQQTWRAAVSVMSNIAEGSCRRSKQEFMRFINIASGSLCEAESQLLLSADLNYIDTMTLDKTLMHSDCMSKVLYALHKSLSSTEYQVPSTEYA